MNTITKTLIALSLALGLSACGVVGLGISATSAVVNTGINAAGTVANTAVNVVK